MMHKKNSSIPAIEYFEIADFYLSQTNKGQKQLVRKWQN